MRAPGDLAEHGTTQPAETDDHHLRELGPVGRQGVLIQEHPGRSVLDGKEVEAETEVVGGPDAPGPQRRGDFRVAHLSEGDKPPAVGLRYFPGAQRRRGIRGAEIGARVQDVGAPQTRGAQRAGIRRVAEYVKEVVRADLFGRRWAGADQDDLVVFGTQLPREFYRDGPVTGHDGMLRRGRRRPAAQLLAEQKTYRFHGGRGRGGGREETSDSERYGKRACTLGRRRVQHEQLKIVKEDVHPAAAEPQLRVM